MGRHADTRRTRHALRRAVESIVSALADGHLSLSNAGRLLDLAGCPFAAACRVCRPYLER